MTSFLLVYLDLESIRRCFLSYLHVAFVTFSLILYEVNLSSIFSRNGVQSPDSSFGSLNHRFVYPPKRSARGGLKYYLIPLLLVDFFIFVLYYFLFVIFIFVFFKTSTSSSSSLFVPINSLSLLETISIGNPRRLAILQNTFRNLSVSVANATSKMTALVAKQVQSQRYLFCQRFLLH